LNTDDLIAALAADAPAERPLTSGLVVALGGALAFCLLAVWTTLGFRSDLGPAMVQPLSALRIVLTLVVLAVALRAALALARPGAAGPGGSGAVWLRPLIWPALAALAAVIWALSVTPVDGWQMAAAGKTLWACLISIPLLSILPVAVILSVLRRGASTAPGLSGAAAGLAGSALAAAAYALHCTEDSPLFYVPWYGVGIAGVTALSAMLGRRLLRW
jgi:hypothetical protein